MNADEYQVAAMRTAGNFEPRFLTAEQSALNNAALGLSGESGEFSDHVKKHLDHGHPLDREHCKKELGDILWYVTRGALALGFTLSEIMEANVDKLNRRYPDGFSHEASLNRSE